MMSGAEVNPALLAPALAEQVRIILLHKHPTSARTRFLRYAGDTVCAFAPLPNLSQVIDGKIIHIEEPGVEFHPSPVVKAAEAMLGLERGDIEIEPDYRVRVDIPGGPVKIFLGRFTTIDPPFEHAEQINGRFIDLTQARDLPDVELQLLRKAYEVVMEG